MSEEQGEERLGTEAYRNELLALVQRAQGLLGIFDRDLDRLGFEEPDLPAALTAFFDAGGSNRLSIVVHDAGQPARDLPRLLELARWNTHRMELRRTDASARQIYTPFAFSEAGDALRRAHFDDLRVLAEPGDNASATRLAQRFADLVASSTPVSLGDVTGL